MGFRQFPVQWLAGDGKGRRKMLKSIWADKRKRITLIAVIGAVALVAAGVGGWFAWSKHELSVAETSCASAAENVEAVRAEYAKLVAGDAKTMGEIMSDQVKDEKTVEALEAELKENEPNSVDCPVGNTKGLKNAAAELGEQADWYKTHEASLSKAVENVTASKLDKAIDDANALLADSNGKVADNAVRDELSKAIEAKDEQAIAEATTKVNDSIAAKTEADAQASRRSTGYGYSNGRTSGSASSSTSTGSSSSSGSTN